MILPLVSRGIVSGVCLVFAKYWYDRRLEKQQQQAAYRNGTAESASGQATHPRALAAAMDVQATRTAASVAAVAETEAPSEDRADAKTAIFDATDAHPATADALSPEWQTPTADSIAEPRRKTTREQKDDDQRVEEALASRDLSLMDMLLEDICDPVLRNRLLKNLVNGYYRRRSDAMNRAAFYRVALFQMEEAPSIMDGIEEIGEPRPDYLEAFKTMAIALDEDGSLDGAIAVCEMALSLGLQDGTKTGFEGRIDRLKQRQMRADSRRPKKLIH